MSKHLNPKRLLKKLIIFNIKSMHPISSRTNKVLKMLTQIHIKGWNQSFNNFRKYESF